MPVWLQYLSPVIVAIISSGATLLIARRRDKTDVAHQAVEILTHDVITPLREQLDAQQEQINHLEHRQTLYFAAVGYIRALCHWLDPAVSAIEPEYMKAHPKPHLPDGLREDIPDQQ